MTPEIMFSCFSDIKTLKTTRPESFWAREDAPDHVKITAFGRRGGRGGWEP
jgi:hypothetical protein